MTSSGILRLFFLALVSGGTATQTPSAPANAVSLTPAIVEAGSPELIRVSAPAGAKLEGDWLGQKLEFFKGRDGRTWFALAGVDVEAPVGSSSLRITATLNGTSGSTIELSRTIEIEPAHYRTGTLTVAPKFVEPPPEEMKRIQAEVELKKNVFAASAPEPLWSGDFHAPVHAPPTDSFGTRRTFNGKLASVHKGMDFRAPMGTPVHAGNSGVVVLARPLYYEGNCVVIDHGLGLYTISMHLSRIDVHEGQHVSLGRADRTERRDRARDGATPALGRALAGRVFGSSETVADGFERGALASLA